MVVNNMNEYTCAVLAMPTVASFNSTCTILCMLWLLMYLNESHMASYGFTDIKNVGFLVQNNQKTINGLHVHERRECLNNREREREPFIPLPFVQGWYAHHFYHSEKRLERD